jgi:hypothetical protein
LLGCSPQAADALRELGIGRNEYIDIMNACKAKKLMWRMNKGLARDLLPSAPQDIRMEGWWLVSVVNVGECKGKGADPALHQHACCCFLYLLLSNSSVLAASVTSVDYAQA